MVVEIQNTLDSNFNPSVETLVVLRHINFDRWGKVPCSPSLGQPCGYSASFYNFFALLQTPHNLTDVVEYYLLETGISHPLTGGSVVE